MPKFLVSLCTIVSLFYVTGTEIRNSRVIVNQSFGLDLCLQWPIIENEAKCNSTEGGKVGLDLWLLSRENVEEYQDDDTPAENRWSKRSLCAILKTDNFPDNGDEREFENRNEAKKKETLLDTEDLFSWRDLEESSDDSDSDNHIRVKRQEELTDALLTEGNSLKRSDDPSKVSESFSKSDRIARSVKQRSNENEHSSNSDDVSKTSVSQKKKRAHPKKVQNKRQQKKRKKASRVKAKKRTRQEKTNVHPVHSNVNVNKRSKEKSEEKIESSNDESVLKLETIRNAWDFGTDLISKATNKLSSDEISTREKRDDENSEKKYESKEEFIPGQKVNDDSKYNAFQFAGEVERLAKLLVAKVGILESYLNPDDPNTIEKVPEVPAIDDLCSNVTVSYSKPESQKSPNECLTSQPFKIETKTPVKRNVLKRKNRGKTSAEQESNENSYHYNKRREVNQSQRKWGRWTDWSSCSVSCGKGRQIRWRYCQHDCEAAETEMVEKACQLPACPPSKFLGIF